MSPIRLGFAGAGAIAQAHAQAAHELDDVEVVGVADPRQDAAAALAEPFGCPSSADPADLAERFGCELVVVCSPPSTHADLSCELLHAGVSVLCEKPLATNTKGALRIAQAAESSDALLSMATKFRFVPDLIQARALVAAGTLGEVVRIENAFTARVDMHRRWNCDPAISGGGVLVDNGTHSVDVLRYLGGPLTDVLATTTRPVQDLETEDGVLLLSRMSGGILGSVDLSWSVDRGSQTYLRVVGSDGVLTVGWAGSRYRRASNPEPVTFGTGYHKIQALRDNLANIVAAMRGTAPLLVGVADALASVHVIDAAYASLREGAWVRVEDVVP